MHSARDLKFAIDRLLLLLRTSVVESLSHWKCLDRDGHCVRAPVEFTFSIFEIILQYYYKAKIQILSGFSNVEDGIYCDFMDITRNALGV